MTSTRLLRSRGKPMLKASDAQSVTVYGASCGGDGGAGIEDRITNEDADDETNNNVAAKAKRSGSVDPLRRSGKKKSKDKELRKQIKVMKKDCKKLQKSLGKWMLESTPFAPSDIKSNVKQFLEENVVLEKPPESSGLPMSKDGLSSAAENTNVYRWDSPHIESFFASNRLRSHIQTNRLDIKLVCPIGKQRIKHPVRGVACNHVQPFDRDTFLKLERVSIGKKKKSFCPICNLEISSNTLVEDSFFVDVLKKSDSKDEDVVVYADGLWHPRSSRDKKRKKGKEEEDEEEVVLDDENDDDDDDDDIRVTGMTKPQKKTAVVIDLTDDSFSLDDDDVVVL